MIDSTEKPKRQTKAQKLAAEKAALLATEETPIIIEPVDPPVKKFNWGPWLFGLLIVCVALLLYFVFRKNPTPPSPLPDQTEKIELSKKLVEAHKTIADKEAEGKEEAIRLAEYYAKKATVNHNYYKISDERNKKIRRTNDTIGRAELLRKVANLTSGAKQPR